MRIATFDRPDDLAAVVGQELAVGPWLALDQERIDDFAALTGDRQWIHVDTELAKRESPFGTTIAHGFLVISMVAASMLEVVRIHGAGMAVIYGVDRVRFISPAPAGCRVRARIALETWTPQEHGGQAMWAVKVEAEGTDKPVAVFGLIVRYAAAGP